MEVVVCGIEVDCLGLRDPAAAWANDMGRLVGFVMIGAGFGVLLVGSWKACWFCLGALVVGFGCLSFCLRLLVDSFSSEKSSRPSLLVGLGSEFVELHESFCWDW